MMRALFFGTACGIVLGMASEPSTAEAAIEVAPVSYSFDGAGGDRDPDGIPPGTWDYHDWSGNQLTDGVYGASLWKADQGKGPAHEWVGWVNTEWICIDFDFGAATKIDAAAIGSYQELTPALIYMPDVFLFGSDDATSWAPLASQTDTDLDGYHRFEFDRLDFNQRYLRVRLDQQPNLPTGNRWTFTDEIDFFQQTVPEPTPMVIWSAFGGLMAWLAWRKTRTEH